MLIGSREYTYWSQVGSRLQILLDPTLPIFILKSDLIPAVRIGCSLRLAEDLGSSIERGLCRGGRHAESPLEIFTLSRGQRRLF
mgnify:CR=1 FL=1